jgi:hypothetical protein
VKRPHTVVLGLGLATLDPLNGVVPMTVADVKGVEISGLIFEAGPVNSPVLLRVGTQHAANGEAREHNGWSDPIDPTALHDVFFRIGGAHVGKATVSLEVNADNTILDNIWAWRADHGTGVGWTSNTADTGLVVNGDNVIATVSSSSTTRRTRSSGTARTAGRSCSRTRCRTTRRTRLRGSTTGSSASPPTRSPTR